MLGLAFIHESIGSVENKKKKIVSFTLAVLLIFSGLLGAFIYLDKTSVSGNPATYIYTEDLEDESTGDVAITEAWYTVDPGELTTVYVTDDTAHGGTKCWNMSGTLSGTTDPFNLLLNATGAEIEYISFYFKENGNLANTQCAFVGYNTSGATAILALRIGDGNVGQSERHLFYKNDTDGYTNTTWEYDHTMWYGINMTINLTDNTINYHFYNGSWYETGWVGMAGAAAADGFDYFKFNYVSTNPEMYLDDIVVGSNTYMGPTGGYPEINTSAFNSSLTKVGEVYYITFSGNQSEVVWSNSSGSGSETMNVTIVDGNVSVTWINISLDDIGTSPHVDAEDFYLYASHLPTSGFNAVSVFPVGGGNVTLDADTWNWANDPFPITGDDSIYFRFRLTIDADQTNQTYTQTTNCGVWIGG